MNAEQIARVCHEANRAFCMSIGDFSQKPWEEAELWQRVSAIDGVRFRIRHPATSASARHDAWLENKKRDGWKFGLLKDPVKKEHPCCVPYEVLPREQKIKDFLFIAIVGAFVEAYRETP